MHNEQQSKKQLENEMGRERQHKKARERDHVCVEETDKATLSSKPQLGSSELWVGQLRVRAGRGKTMQPGLSKFKFMAGWPASSILAKWLAVVLQGGWEREESAQPFVCKCGDCAHYRDRERRKEWGSLCGRTTRSVQILCCAGIR